MIAFFPETYPDELLFSQIARYNVRVGYNSISFTYADIYKTPKNFLSVDYINDYTSDAFRWITRQNSWEKVVFENTLWPIYVRFLPQAELFNAINNMLSYNCYLNPKFFPIVNGTRFIKFCPECVKSDRQMYGETYWHRNAQLPKIRVCPKHKCFLENSTVRVFGGTTKELCDAESTISQRLTTRKCENELEIIFTQYILDTLQMPISLENIPIGDFLRSKLSHKYINDDASINTSMLHKFCVYFYGYKTPTLDLTYLQKIFQNCCFDYFSILQLAFFLGIPVYDITYHPQETYIQKNEILFDSLSKEFNVDYSIVKSIADSVLKEIAPRSFFPYMKKD